MSRVRAGLCSVTLRGRTVEEVARVASDAGVEAIEWGADVHVPPGDAGAIGRAAAASHAAGVAIASYGSYLFAGGAAGAEEWRPVLDTAVTLGAPHVRVWTGFGVEADTAAYGALVDALRGCCADAVERGVTVSVEFHGGTPTATVAGAIAVLDAVGAPNLRSLWQPPYWRGPTDGAADAAEVDALGARLSHLHVYEWADAATRLPLAAGITRWTAVLDAVRALDGDHDAFLEFVTDDDPGAVVRDTATLRAWLDPVTGPDRDGHRGTERRHR